MYKLPLRLPLLVMRTTSQEFGTGLSNITRKWYNLHNIFSFNWDV